MLTIDPPPDIDVSDLLVALKSCSVSFPGIRVVCDTLPGRSICAAAIVDGVLWVVLDFDKPSAPLHAHSMIREAMARCRAAKQPEATVALSPTVSPRAPLALAS